MPNSNENDFFAISLNTYLSILYETLPTPRGGYSGKKFSTFSTLFIFGNYCEIT
jgi:hypothetical protein